MVAAVSMILGPASVGVAGAAGAPYPGERIATPIAAKRVTVTSSVKDRRDRYIENDLRKVRVQTGPKRMRITFVLGPDSDDLRCGPLTAVFGVGHKRHRRVAVRNAHGIIIATVFRSHHRKTATARVQHHTGSRVYAVTVRVRDLPPRYAHARWRAATSSGFPCHAVDLGDYAPDRGWVTP